MAAIPVNFRLWHRHYNQTLPPEIFEVVKKNEKNLRNQNVAHIFATD
jgi:hypothetical protein